MANSLIKTGISKQFFGEQSYTKEDLDLFINNYDTFTEDSIETGYGFDMKTLSLISSQDGYATLLFNGQPIINDSIIGMSFYPVTITLKDQELEFNGYTATASKNGVILATATFDNGSCVLNLMDIGEYLITCDTYVIKVSVLYFGQYIGYFYRNYYMFQSGNPNNLTFDINKQSNRTVLQTINSISFTSSSSSDFFTGAIYTPSKINITNYKKLYIKVNLTANINTSYYPMIGIKTTAPVYNEAGDKSLSLGAGTGTKIVYLDLTEFTGDYYLFFQTGSANGEILEFYLN